MPAPPATLTNNPVIAVMGPTASGKSALGIELARRFAGEIINCDSVQVYREIEIATAKVTPAEQRGVPHHLIDFVPPAERYTAGRWADDARSIIARLERRGRLPIIVGGTGLYLRALRQPLFAAPPVDEALRARLSALRDRRGSPHLHRILRRLDPATAARLAPADAGRIIRALEIRFQTGRTLDAHHAEQHRLADAAPDDDIAARLHVFVLDPPRDELYRHIDARTRDHFARGLVAEVRDLLARGVPADSQALGAHGYRRVVEHLRGARTLDDAIIRTQQDVRRYAKRQWTWFRREPAVEWLTGFGDDPATIERAAALIGRMKAEG